MADTTNVKINLDAMLVEAGMLTNGLSPYATSMELAQRIEAEQKQAMDAGEYQLTLSFSPFEAGLVLQGLAQAQNTVCDDLLGRLHDAILKALSDAGITSGPGLGGQQASNIIDDSQPQPMDDEQTNYDEMPSDGDAGDDSSAPAEDDSNSGLE